MTQPFSLPLFDAEAVSLLIGGDIADVLMTEIEGARRRLWASYFIVALAVEADPDRRVRRLCDAFVRAARRGVDVRLLVDTFETPEAGYDVNLVAAHYLDERGVPVRIYQSERRSSTHSKYLLVDPNIQIVGSGNLTQGGLLTNLEMALRTESADLFKWLAQRFLRKWDAALVLVPLP